MSFNDEDKALIKNSHQFKNTVHGVYCRNFWRKLEKEGMGHLTKKDGKQEAPTKGMRAADRSTRILKRTA